MRNIPVSGKIFAEEEKQAVLNWLASGEEIAHGKFYEQFERMLANYIGMPHAFYVNSGSSANLLAFAAFTSPNTPEHLRVKPGDEIITLAASFPTTVAPIVQYGCIPVFVDIDIPTYNIKVEDLEKAISPKTKGVFIAHTLGNPFDVYPVIEFCNKHGLWLIEDNADSLDSRYHGVRTGSFGHISTTSFYPAHHMSTGGGGAVFTFDPQLAKVIRSMRGWGKSCFIAGTQIQTTNGLQNIEDIHIGDFVYTHTGQYMPVTDTITRTARELIRVKAEKHEEITCTPEHEFYVLPLDNSPHTYRYRGIPMPEPTWIQAKDLKPSHYLLEKVPRFVSVPLDKITWSYEAHTKVKTEELLWTEELGRLCGYWLAEGNLAKADKYSNGKKSKGSTRHKIYYKYRVDFSFHKDETEYIEDVQYLMNKFFGITNKYMNRPKNSKGVTLNFNTRKGYEFFQQIFGEYSYKKALPACYLQFPKDVLMGFLKGFWRGDGSSWEGGMISSKLRRSCFSMCTTSQILAEQLRKIMLMFEINPSYSIKTPEQHYSSVVNGKEIIAKRNSYILSVYGINAEILASVIDEPVINLTGHVQFNFTDDKKYAVYVLKDLSYIKQDDTVMVYDLTVSTAHSYHANNLIVHNCHCPANQDNVCGKRFDWKFKDLPDGYDHKYVFSEFGYNLTGTNIQAAIGVEQIKKLPAFTEARHRNFNLLDSLLQDVDFVHPVATVDSEPSWFGYPILLTKHDRKAVIAKLNEKGVNTRLLFAGNITRQPCFTTSNVPYRIVTDLINTDNVLNNLFWIGCWHGLTEEDIHYEAEVVKEVLQ